ALKEITLKTPLNDAAVEGEFKSFLDDDATLDQLLHRGEQLLVNILNGGDAFMDPSRERQSLRLYGAKILLELLLVVLNLLFKIFEAIRFVGVPLYDLLTVLPRFQRLPISLVLLVGCIELVLQSLDAPEAGGLLAGKACLDVWREGGVDGALFGGQGLAL